MATAWGYTLIEIGMEAQMPFDFRIHSNGSTSLVRVRKTEESWLQGGDYLQVLCRADQGKMMGPGEGGSTVQSTGVWH
jgi:hypothetical protein